jgi:hypothetical protein
VATGEPYLNEYMVICRFKDEKLVVMKEFVDSAYFTKVLSAKQPDVLVSVQCVCILGSVSNCSTSLQA